MTRRTGKWSTRDMTAIALMAVLMCLCTWIAIPAAVPFTLQTFAVFAAVELLGPRRAFWSVAVYLLMGAVGLPVFSGMTGGFGILLGQTGGYLWGFLLLPLICRGAAAAGQGRLARIVGMVLGMLACYGLGTAWFVFVSGGTGWITALTMCVLPFLLPDAIKLALAVSFADGLRKRRVI
ncbi:MAG: biotin transporter BioY [Ruminococcaceae bacterium]|nr:biotin transporter BioY [Oscillospiraceae bacterium]